MIEAGLDHSELTAALLRGERRAIARVLTLVENDPDGDLAAELYRHSGRAHVVGVTGAPGSGKSTLVSAMAGVYRTRGQRVGIIAVDPSSPFTGGAVLGDRVRMASHSGDEGVFIRSMASRGSLGGLALATGAAVRALDASGCDVVVVETVGAGQAEVEIAAEAHTTVVVVVPGLGDDIQAIKAGILEIADVYCVNKSDAQGADRTVAHLKAMQALGRRDGAGEWTAPVVQTVATTGSGVDSLVDAVESHRAHLVEGPGWLLRERQRAAAELRRRLERRLVQGALAAAGPDQVAAVVEELVGRHLAPDEAVEAILSLAGAR